MAAAVSALHALLSGDQGLAAFTQATGAVPQLLLALRPAGCITEDRLPQIFIMQMLLKLCMFSPAAYAVTLHGLLGEEPPERQQPGHVGGQPTDADKLKSTPCSPPSEQHIVSAPEPAAAPRAEWPAAGSMPSNPPPPAPPPPPRLPAGGRAGHLALWPVAACAEMLLYSCAWYTLLYHSQYTSCSFVPNKTAIWLSNPGSDLA